MLKALLMLLTLPLLAQAGAGSQPVPTIAGDLNIIHNEAIRVSADDNVCALRLGGKLLYIEKCEFEYRPQIIANIRKSINGEQRKIIVIQRIPAGNACNGGPIFVVEIFAKSDPVVSPELDFCGGKDPVVTDNAKGILITFPGGPVNQGSGRTPTERWQYQGGSFMKVR